MKKTNKKINLENYIIVDARDFNTLEDVSLGFVLAKANKVLTKDEFEALAAKIADYTVEMLFQGCNCLIRLDNGKIIRSIGSYVEKPKKSLWARIKSWFKRS